MNRRSPLSLCLGIALALTGAAAPAAEHTADSLEAVREKVSKQEAVLVDVREKREWDAGHLRDAAFAPLSRIRTEDGLKEVVGQLPKDKVVYLHCQAGVRCLTAAELLKQQGFDVRALKPGYPDLLRAGFPKAEP